jgi:hypothetical protein
MDPDSDPHPAIFMIDIQDADKKLFFVKKVFLYITFKGTFTLFFKDKKSQRSKKKKNSRNQGFSYHICLPGNDRRFRIRIQEVQKHVHPGSDPDPQQCKKHLLSMNG